MEEALDHYESDVFRWCHLSRPSPELLAALAQRWIWPSGPVVDLGCGAGVEARYLSSLGFLSLGIDLSGAALRQARTIPSSAVFLPADIRRLSLRDASVRFLLDRGCFHYLVPDQHTKYEREARRVLVPGGRLLLRACLRQAGVRNDVDEDLLRRTYADWTFVRIDHEWIPSDTRTMGVLVAWVQRG